MPPFTVTMTTHLPVKEDKLSRVVEYYAVDTPHTVPISTVYIAKWAAADLGDTITMTVSSKGSLEPIHQFDQGDVIVAAKSHYHAPFKCGRCGAGYGPEKSKRNLCYECEHH